MSSDPKADLAAVKASASEQQAMALKMREDGFSNSEIAAALGYTTDQINLLLQEKVELGSPEDILQECLKTVVSLIPLADMTYRAAPVGFNANSLTGFIDTARNLINEIYSLKTKEETYKQIVQKVLEVFCRDMVKVLLNEVAQLKEKDLAQPKKLEDELTKFSLSVGKRFQECYRKSREDLGDVLGVGPDARARINIGLNNS